jgi:MYXO-CTERM domain-containing protein
MTRSLACVAVLLLGSVSSQARAAEGLLRNDTLPTDGGALQVRSGVVFADYQGAVVVLGGQGTSFPVTLTGVDMLYVPQSGAGVQEPWDLDIWQVPDAGVAAVPNRGDLYNVSIGIDTSTTAFNRYTLPVPLQITAPIVVRLRHSYDNATWSYQGTMALDHGPVVPGANWFDSALVGGIHSMDLPDAGVPDDNWVIRGVLDVDGGPATSTGSTSGSGTGSTAGSTGSTGSTGSASTTGATGTGTSTGSSSTGGVTSGTTGAGVTLTSIAPAEAFSADTTTVNLVGSNFAFGVQAFIGTTLLSDVQLRSPAVLSATLKPGLAAGTYDVKVINPDAREAVLRGAFVVHAGTGGSGAAGGSGSTSGGHGAKSGGCGSAQGGDALWMLLPLLGLALGRRQRKPVTGCGT